MNKIKEILTSKVILTFLMIVFVLLAKKNSAGFRMIFLIILSIIILSALIGIILKKYKFSVLAVLVLIISALFYLRIINLNEKYENAINNFKNGKSLLGRVESQPVKNQSKIIMNIRVAGFKFSERADYSQIPPFMILLKIKEADDLIIRQGDVLEISQNIKLSREKIFDFNYRDYLFNKKIYGVINAKQNKIKIINNEKMLPVHIKILKKSIWKARELTIFMVKNKFSNEVSSFLLSIFLGLRNEIDEEQYDQFRNTGMVHLLAISGLHIGFIGMLFFKLFHFILSKSKSLIISIVFLFFYMLIIAPSASSARAFIMYVVCAVYFISGMKTVSINNLAVSAIILMFINPYCIFDLGFQFSFLATAGIMLLAGIISEKLPYFIPQKVKSIIAVTFSAFSSIFCLQWSIFGEVAVFSIISSIAVVPIFGYYFAVCFIFLLLLVITNFYPFVFLIELLSKLFLMMIDFLDIIPTMKLPAIPRFSSYIILPLLVIYFYIIHEKLVFIIKNIKLKRVAKILKADL